MTTRDAETLPGGFVDLLSLRAAGQPARRAYTFLVDGEEDAVSVTYAELDRRARAVAAHLAELGVPAGARALLLYPPGIEYIVGFFGCLYAGVVAVPAYPPDPGRLPRTLPRIEAIVADAQPTVALSTTDILALSTFVFAAAPELRGLRWIATDALADAEGCGWTRPVLTRESLAFLQYTSGSTGAPKGVMLTHGNLLANSRIISDGFEARSDATGVIWLPPYHDMGLIGGILQPLYERLPGRADVAAGVPADGRCAGSRR